MTDLKTYLNESKKTLIHNQGHLQPDKNLSMFQSKSHLLNCINHAIWNLLKHTLMKNEL